MWEIFCLSEVFMSCNDFLNSDSSYSVTSIVHDLVTMTRVWLIGHHGIEQCDHESSKNVESEKYEIFLYKWGGKDTWGRLMDLVKIDIINVFRSCRQQQPSRFFAVLVQIRDTEWLCPEWGNDWCYYFSYFYDLVVISNCEWPKYLAIVIYLMCLEQLYTRTDKAKVFIGPTI